MSYQHNFNIWLKEELEKAHLTQSDLCIILKIHRSVISNWLTGRYVPTAKRIMLLVELFGEGTHNQTKLLQCMQAIINSMEKGKKEHV